MRVSAVFTVVLWLSTAHSMGLKESAPAGFSKPFAQGVEAFMNYSSSELLFRYPRYAFDIFPITQAHTLEINGFEFFDLNTDPAMQKVLTDARQLEDAGEVEIILKQLASTLPALWAEHKHGEVVKFEPMTIPLWRFVYRSSDPNTESHRPFDRIHKDFDSADVRWQGVPKDGVRKVLHAINLWILLNEKCPANRVAFIDAQTVDGEKDQISRVDYFNKGYWNHGLRLEGKYGVFSVQNWEQYQAVMFLTDKTYHTAFTHAESAHPDCAERFRESIEVRGYLTVAKTITELWEDAVSEANNRAELSSLAEVEDWTILTFKAKLAAAIVENAEVKYQDAEEFLSLRSNDRNM